MIIRSLWHVSNNKSFLWNEMLKTHDKESTYIKAKYSLVSTGTERLVAMGNVPKNCFQQMKVPYMDGAFTFPIKYGYNMIGTEMETSSPVQLMHPHQNICLVSQQDIHSVPEHIPLRRATLYGTMETVINAIWDARLSDKANQKILVVGGGLIGMTLAFTLKHILNQKVYLQEVNPFRQSFALKHGLKENTSSGYDLAFNTTSNEQGLQHAIDRVGYEGKVIEMSWYGTKKVTLELGGSFHYHRKQLISSQVSKIPGYLQKTESYDSRRTLVWEYLKSAMFDKLITHDIAFGDLPKWYDALRNGENDFIGCLVHY